MWFQTRRYPLRSPHDPKSNLLQDTLGSVIDSLDRKECFARGSLHLRSPRDEAVQNCPVWSEKMPNDTGKEARFRNYNTIKAMMIGLVIQTEWRRF